MYLHQGEAARLRPAFKAFEQSGGNVVIAGRGHTDRDAAMTRASHYDILRFRTEEECRALYGQAYRKRVSGTEKNALRRLQGVGLVWVEPGLTESQNPPLALEVPPCLKPIAGGLSAALPMAKSAKKERQAEGEANQGGGIKF